MAKHIAIALKILTESTIEKFKEINDFPVWSVNMGIPLLDILYL